MILAQEYFQDSISNFGYTPTDQDYERCDDLLTRVNALFADGLGLPCELRSGHRTRAKSRQLIASGYRAALGGQHEQSNAVDVADVGDHGDQQIDDGLLAQYGLYREAPSSTESWVHLQTVAPKSGKRTFQP